MVENGLNKCDSSEFSFQISLLVSFFMRFSFKFLFLRLTVSWKKEFPVLGLIWASWIVHWDICELSIFDYYNVSRLFVPNLLVWEDPVKFLICAIKSSNRSIYILRCFRCSFNILATWSSWGIIIWFLAMLVLDSTIYLSRSRSFCCFAESLIILYTVYQGHNQGLSSYVSQKN